MIYKSKPRSYRDLPLRLAEFGTVYRFEQSGELSGMTRVRGFTQDDAHIFCTEEQVADEFRALRRDDAVRAEDAGAGRLPRAAGLPRSGERQVRRQAGGLGPGRGGAGRRLPRAWTCPTWTSTVGEAAFYGPKVDFIVRDCIGREWQLGTVQLDYNLPSAERFDLEYIGADNQPHRPVMIHRAPFGSMERFMGMLIEHFAGAFPLWLAPEQVRVLAVSEKVEEYGRSVQSATVGGRAARRRATIGPKRSARKSATPSWSWSPTCSSSAAGRWSRGRWPSAHRREGDLGAMPVEAALAKLQEEIRAKALR